LLEGRISPEEAGILIEWLSRDQQDPEAKASILIQLQRVVDDHRINEAIQTKLEARLPAILGHEENAESSPIRTRTTPLPRIRYVSVAAALFLISAGIYLFLSRHQSFPTPAIARTAPAKTDIPPGRQGAILTLADGHSVVLDSLRNGVVAVQGGTKVTLDNGRLAYATANPATAEIPYNTMTTPKGRQFQLTLPDGTRVWLNAASSLRYPTAFSGGDRKVMMTGEAYFEVASDAKHPFRVEINQSTAVEVLGTNFDINAYSDETSIKTTLIEGAVRISSGSEKVLLKPGQQASSRSSSPIKIVSNVPIDKVMAWKNGVFDFQDAKLEEVMRQLQRWYDIEVVYENGIPNIEFIGKMGRDLSLSEVLGGLQLSKVHFRMEGRKLVVLP